MRNLLIVALLSLLTSTVIAQDSVPVRTDAGWSYVDPLYGISISYPDAMKMKLSQEIRKKLESVGAGLSPNLRDGSRFSLGAVAYKCDGIVPSLTCNVQGISPEYGEVTTERLREWVAGSDGEEGYALEAERQVEIQNKAFTLLKFRYLNPRKRVPRLGHYYYHFDQETRVFYSFVIEVCPEHAERDIRPLEEALATVRFGKVKGPAPMEVLGPSSRLEPADSAGSRWRAE